MVVKLSSPISSELESCSLYLVSSTLNSVNCTKIFCESLKDIVAQVATIGLRLGNCRLRFASFPLLTEVRNSYTQIGIACFASTVRTKVYGLQFCRAPILHWLMKQRRTVAMPFGGARREQQSARIT